MPFNFTAYPLQFTAKGKVVSDGEVFTVGTGVVASGTASGTSVLSYTGTQAVSGLSDRTAFASLPVHGATGAWQISTRDPVVKVLNVAICPVFSGTASGLSPLLVQQQPTASSGGQLVISWLFMNTSGLPTEMPVGSQFRVYVVYAE